jgi:NifU-like protein involved in Fe-S cluster formation
MSHSAAVLERARDPRYVGWLPRDAPDVGTGEAGSIDAGTMTRIQVRINPATRCIEQAVFKVLGGSEAIASASLVAERLHGASIHAALGLDGLNVVAELQLPVERARVAALAVEASRNAIADWEQKR